MNLSSLNLQQTFHLNTTIGLKDGPNYRLLVSDNGPLYLSFKVLLFTGFFSANFTFSVNQDNLRDPNIVLRDELSMQLVQNRSKRALVVPIPVFLPLDRYQLDSIANLYRSADALYNDTIDVDQGSSLDASNSNNNNN